MRHEVDQIDALRRTSEAAQGGCRLTPVMGAVVGQMQKRLPQRKLLNHAAGDTHVLHFPVQGGLTKFGQPASPRDLKLRPGLLERVRSRIIGDPGKRASTLPCHRSNQITFTTSMGRNRERSAKIDALAAAVSTVRTAFGEGVEELTQKQSVGLGKTILLDLTTPNEEIKTSEVLKCRRGSPTCADALLIRDGQIGGAGV
jgi:hypothetical protein